MVYSIHYYISAAIPLPHYPIPSRKLFHNPDASIYSPPPVNDENQTKQK